MAAAAFVWGRGERRGQINPSHFGGTSNLRKRYGGIVVIILRIKDT
jgi:hypothetical protein